MPARSHLPIGSSLTELTGIDLGDPDNGETGLARTVRRLYRTPLGELTPGDLTLLLFQQVALLRLVPLGLAIVEDDPEIAARYYAGDLIHALVVVDPVFWIENADLAARLTAVLRRLDVTRTELDDAQITGIERFLRHHQE